MSPTLRPIIIDLDCLRLFDITTFILVTTEEEEEEEEEEENYWADSSTQIALQPR